MVVAALRERAAQGRGWQPDRRASSALALLAAMLAGLGFLGLIHRPVQPAAERGATALFLQAPLPVRTLQHRPARSLRSQSPAPIAPQILQLPLPAVLETPQDLLDAGTREYPEEQESNGVFVVAPRRHDELSRALGAPDKPRTLQAGEGYRSAYGDAIFKSGDGCAAIREVHVGPGGAKALVGSAVPCPGSDLSSMEDALSAWAKKVKAGWSPPDK